MAVNTLSTEDKEFLAKCEEQLKDRFTDKDEQFMAVFNADPSTPPIIENWWVPQNAGRRNDRRNNRRNHPYERNRDRNFDRRDNYDRRGYNDYNRGYDDRGYGNRSQRPRY
uniref:RNMT-activating mini protein n=1 Tax=Pectinophora gossypiella TaxID=13191 RepID=A0A1E1WTB5_PECGO